MDYESKALSYLDVLRGIFITWDFRVVNPSNF
jgi:hypothetical protein